LQIQEFPAFLCRKKRKKASGKIDQKAPKATKDEGTTDRAFEELSIENSWKSNGYTSGLLKQGPLRKVCKEINRVGDIMRNIKAGRVD